MSGRRPRKSNPIQGSDVGDFGRQVAVTQTNSSGELATCQNARSPPSSHHESAPSQTYPCPANSCSPCRAGPNRGSSSASSSKTDTCSGTRAPAAPAPASAATERRVRTVRPIRPGSASRANARGVRRCGRRRTPATPVDELIAAPAASAGTAPRIEDDQNDGGRDRDQNDRQHQPASASPRANSSPLCLSFLECRHGITSKVHAPFPGARGSAPCLPAVPIAEHEQGASGADRLAGRPTSNAASPSSPGRRLGEP